MNCGVTPQYTTNLLATKRKVIILSYIFNFFSCVIVFRQGRQTNTHTHTLSLCLSLSLSVFLSVSLSLSLSLTHTHKSGVWFKRFHRLPFVPMAKSLTHRTWGNIQYGDLILLSLPILTYGFTLKNQLCIKPNFFGKGFNHYFLSSV